MATKKNNNSKSVNFFKKNIYYILLFVCLAAIATIITLAVVLDSKPTAPAVVPPGNGNEEPTVTPPVTFLIPVSSDYTLGHGYTGDETLIWSSTQKQYEAHLAIDFKVAAGSTVVSVLDGEVIGVDIDDMDGLVVSIRHENGTVTVYKGLDVYDERVMVGETVERGQVIGTVSAKTLYELNVGPHLHFEVWTLNEETGKLVDADPMDYYPDLGK